MILFIGGLISLGIAIAEEIRAHPATVIAAAVTLLLVAFWVMK